MRIRAEHGVKKAKASAFLDAEGTGAECEAKAIASTTYDLAVEEKSRAVSRPGAPKRQTCAHWVRWHDRWL
jgi:hypothetical protein